MKSIRVALILLLSGCATALAADLGAVWSPVVPEARTMWLRSEGTLDARLVRAHCGAHDLHRANLAGRRPGTSPLRRGVPRYRAFPLPNLDGRSSHVITVRFRQAVPEAPTPVLAIAPEDGITSRLALLNLPLVSLRIFAGLFSLLLSLQLFALALRQRSRETYLLCAALFLNAISELTPRSSPPSFRW